ncbi:MAG: hypothetical protein ABL961_18760 [Vicinamibacterales bacterium]
MKKLLTSVAFAAALFTGATAAQAAPVLTLSITDSTATLGQCTTIGGAFSAGTCTLSSGSGVITVSSTYGSAMLDFLAGNSAPFRPEPELWLNHLVLFGSAGTQIIKLIATGYTSPFGNFNAKLLPGATTGPNASATIDYYYSAANLADPTTGTALHTVSIGPSDVSGTPFITPLIHNAGDEYSQAWVLTATSLAAGATVGGALEVVSAPTPTPLALLGLGLAALALVSRRKLGQSAI